jgi:hypothetical protein
MAQPCWYTAVHKGGPQVGTGQSVRFPSDLENSKELLDGAGEWFADFGDEKTIYYIPLPGQTPYWHKSK